MSISQFSPQTNSIVSSLVNGQVVKSENLNLGPLTKSSSILLSIVSNNYSELCSISGDTRAEKFIALFLCESEALGADELASLAECAGNEVNIDSTESSHPQDSWLIQSLKAQSYRGLAPYGEEVSFPFDALSNLIYGPNGSGKSSLLGALHWVFTGITPVDFDTKTDSSDYYEITTDNRRGKKIGSWPVCVTLPADDIGSMEPHCAVSVELVSMDKNRKLYIRRQYPERLEFSEDYETWKPVSSFSDHGISPLDLQLSLVASLTFSKKKLDETEDSGAILKKLLGYDDLSNIGKLAKDIDANLTRKRTSLTQEKGKLNQEIESLLEQCMEEATSDDGLDKIQKLFVELSEVNLTNIADIGKQINLEITEKDLDIANALGIELEEESKSKVVTVSDNLIKAVDRLEKGLPLMLKKFSSINPNFVAEEFSIELVAEEFYNFVVEMKEEIRERIEWAKKEAANDKLRLLTVAAEHYDDQSGNCPVCEQSIEELDIQSELVTLKTLPPHLKRNLSDLFSDFMSELESLTGSSLVSFQLEYPKETVLNEIGLFEKEFDGIFSKVLTEYTKTAKKRIGSIEEIDQYKMNLLPEDCPESIVSLARNLASIVKKIHSGIEVYKWSQQNFQELSDIFEDKLFGSESENSLHSLFLKGKAAADTVGALKRMKGLLKTSYSKIKEKDVLDNSLDIIGTVKLGMESVKKTAEFSESEVTAFFNEIAHATNRNWDLLYPEAPSSLKKAGITQNKKVIEPLLATNGCSVPAKFYANSGLQRAIALAFLFALFEKHSRGLAFIVLDDSIVSLDEEHRESWSSKILRPLMDKFQIILATHQLEYLNNCQEDFNDGNVYQLNLRNSRNRISWQPGRRLEKAKKALGEDFTMVPNELRKYIEDLLDTLDAYSPDAFIRNDIPARISSLRTLPASNPLKGRSEVGQILQVLGKNEVKKVYNAGSHAPTEHQVTHSMCRDAHKELLKCDESFKRLLIKLNSERRPSRRARGLPSDNIIDFPMRVSANLDEVLLPFIGQAAAKPDSLVIDEQGSDFEEIAIPQKEVILVCSDSLEPVAQKGQILLLAEADIDVKDGDLVAVVSIDDGYFLRRVWSDRENWVLQSINPISMIKAETIPKSRSSIRRVDVVLYDENVPNTVGASNFEWELATKEMSDLLENLKAIMVTGDSLEPIAKAGQKVLVRAPVTLESSEVKDGDLVIVETTNSSIGTVVKRIFHSGGNIQLVSSNPIDQHRPISIKREEIAKLWPLRGVILAE